jgi:hypothetical protein
MFGKPSRDEFFQTARRLHDRGDIDASFHGVKRGEPDRK